MQEINVMRDPSAVREELQLWGMVIALRNQDPAFRTQQWKFHQQPEGQSLTNTNTQT